MMFSTNLSNFTTSSLGKRANSASNYLVEEHTIRTNQQPETKPSDSNLQTSRSVPMTPSPISPISNNKTNKQARALTRKAAATQDPAERVRLLRLAFDRELSSYDRRIQLDNVLHPVNERRKLLLRRLGHDADEDANEQLDTIDNASDHDSQQDDDDDEEDVEVELDIQAIELEIPDAADSSSVFVKETAEDEEDEDEIATQISIETVECIGDDNNNVSKSELLDLQKEPSEPSPVLSGSTSPTTHPRRPRKLVRSTSRTTSASHRGSEPASVSSSPTSSRRRPRKLERIPGRNGSESLHGSVSGSVSPASSRQRPKKLELRHVTATATVSATAQTGGERKKKPKKLEVRSQNSP